MNTSPNGDAAPQSVHLPHNILTLAKQHGYTKPNGEPNVKALADAADIPDSTLYRNLKKPEKFNVEHLDALAELFGIGAGDLFKAPRPKAA